MFERTRVPSLHRAPQPQRQLDLASSEVNPIRTLQRTLGNRAVQGMLRARFGRQPVQASLMVGAANDPYELEADRISDQVLGSPSSLPRHDIQVRTLAADGQGTSNGAFEADPQVERAVRSSTGGGSALPEPTRSVMEAQLGADFSGVRLHTDSGAAELSRTLAAKAFTVGQDIYLGAGQYRPGSGTRLLAHELVHVMQQSTANQPPRAARAAMQRLIGNRQTQRVIQRAIGFEYEFGTRTFKTEPETGFKSLFSAWGTPTLKGPQTPLAKREQLGPARDGFLITGDELAGGSDLEIIVPHIDDTQIGGRAQMVKTLNAVKLFLDQLELLGTKYPNGVPATEFKGYANYWIAGADTGLFAGQLQATAGLSMRAIQAIRTGAAGEAILAKVPKVANAMPGDRAYGRRFGAEIAAAAGGAADPDLRAAVWKHVALNARALQLERENLGALEAIVSLIAQVPFTARKGIPKIPYPKAAAGAMLARTDFAHILGLLPRTQLKAIYDHPNVWVEMVTAVVLEANPTKAIQESQAAEEATVKHQGYPTPLGWTPKYGLRIPIFPDYAFDATYRGPSYETGLDLRTWLRGLVAVGARDLLTEENYPKELPAQQAQNLESLGGYGFKMDQGYGAEPPRPIFEFRSLPSVSRDLLVDVGKAIWDYVYLAHGKPKRT